MKKQFTYYMHDDANRWERADEIGEQIGHHFTDEEVDRMGRPFYEIALNCEIDMDTMEVTILGEARQT